MASEKWCYIQHSDIRHHADWSDNYPSVEITAVATLPRSYTGALIDVGKFRELVPGLISPMPHAAAGRGQEGSR
ncbi:MAG: hypothetical protein ILM98_14055 [Kiritimatiellae bacterium]|nr:hypothetical protein [Kiritimatiellia bacterium]